MELIYSPWINKFKDLIGSTKKEFIFASPFIKFQSVKFITDNWKNKFSISGLTNFKLRNFEKGVSDISALKHLSNYDSKICNISNLHSKAYVFDDKYAVVSSANLTGGGMSSNLELGVLITDIDLVLQLKQYLKELANNLDFSNEITIEILNESEKIIENSPKFKEIQAKDYKEIERNLFQEIISDEDIIFQGGSEVILSGLTGWKKDVFESVLKIDSNIFNLNEVYQFSSRLSKLYPENKNIEAKIRQQLQVLRDMGLIEFTAERGTYRKLWI